MIMLDPHRTFAADTRPGEPRIEPRPELHVAPLDVADLEVDAAEARLVRALASRLRRVRIERAPATLRERVRALLDARA